MYYNTDFTVAFYPDSTLNYPYYNWYYYNAYSNQNLISTSTSNLLENSKNEEQKIIYLHQEKINKRNILPNIFRKIISFICNRNISEGLILKRFEQIIDELDLIKFYQYMNKVKQEFPKYISKKNILQFWRGDKQCYFLNEEEHKTFHKIIRVLSKLFLQHHAIKWILLSKKMKKTLKNEHIKFCRIMKQMLIELRTL